ncbi:MAG: 5-histidylcysteine sulfoxide synthase [Merismopedia sp. SIO2A8]|nr:5-histidylcysteine sulfoxide synthase [Merismopedia sp. SIO2A8]
MITQECNQVITASTPQLNQVSAEGLIEQFEQAWALEDTLMNSLVEGDTFYLNPDPLRNPLIFYLGHSAVFYINKLIRVGLLDQRINPEYETLFEIGVDPSTPEELTAATQSIKWPDVEQVWDYREQAKEAIATAIRYAPLNLPIHQQHPLWAFLMGIEHSRIHFETSSMLIRQLPLHCVQRPSSWSYAPTTVTPTPSTHAMAQIPGGKVDLGKAQDALTYGWDSDYGHQRVEVKPFWVSPFLMTNREFLAFVEAGGYQNPSYWSETAWEWVNQQQVKHPKFWRATVSPQPSTSNTDDINGVDRGSHYRYRAMFDDIDLPLDWPVEVNHYEAMAFCRWKGDGIRLLTEAEWNQALAINGSFSTENTYNLDYRWGSPCTVGWLEQSTPFNPKQSTPQKTEYVYDLRGNVWEWLGDPFAPLPGFHPHDLYADYAQPFFDNQHYLMVGGSWASTGAYASAQCRNWFRPYFHQHVGFRIARDAE